ncbi:MAG: hypothetical protein V4440_01850 [Pseudomonadota bacterium]
MFRFKHATLVQLSICVGFMLMQMSAYAESESLTSIESTVSNVAEVGDSEATQSSISSISKELLSEKQVPNLMIIWDCGNCVQNDKVIPLIEEEYKNIAIAKGYTVAVSETAEVVITAYRQRNPGMRVMFGVFAGKDTLATRITFRDKNFFAKDYAANAIAGMNSLCASVTQKIFNHIVTSIQMQ